MIKFIMFLVGGAIRDKLLKNDIIEFDWLIVGETPESILFFGFKKVGKDFPVFLHPYSKEEYSLARKEKKIGKGYYGFKCDFSFYVLLNEDLFRRDLTINSISLDCYGNLIDCFSGTIDLSQKRFLHISFAFFEDPLRVLRVFRFFIRYLDYGFYLSFYIISIIKKIVLLGDFLNLTLERILKEIFLCFKYKNSFLVFHFLYRFDLLNFLFYDLFLLFNFSKKFCFNIFLDFINQISILTTCLYSYTNNVVLKFCVIFSRLTFNILIYNKFNKIFFYNKKNFLLISRNLFFLNSSKRYKSFLFNFCKFKFFFDNKLFIGDYYFLMFLLKINAFKDKIKLINLILLCDLDAKITNKVYNFYCKYFFLDLLNILVLSKLFSSDLSHNYFNNFFLKNVFYRYNFFYNRYNFF